MTAQRSRDELLEAARLYYVEGMRQSDVAAKLHVSRSNVSRMLRAAREQGVIRFQLTYPGDRDGDLERQLVNRYARPSGDGADHGVPGRRRGLRHAVVLRTDSQSSTVDPREYVGSMTARWLVSQLTDGQKIAVCWGRTLRATVNQVIADRVYDVHVNQLGGDLHLEPHWSSHEMVRELAVRLGASYSYLHSPAFVDSPVSARALFADRAIAAELKAARQADIAIVGVGAFGVGSNQEFILQAHMGDAERNRARRQGVVGELCGRFYTRDGVEADLPIRRRIISVSLQDLLAIPTVIGLATGAEKGPAVDGALRGGLVNVLICDSDAAAAALAHEEPR